LPEIHEPVDLLFFARYLRYSEKTILGISTICLWLFFSNALISNKTPSKSTNSYMGYLFVKAGSARIRLVNIFGDRSKMQKTTDRPTGQRIKVTLVAGFLGSGKTTLLKHILSWQEDLSDTVVIVNEFGEIGIDGALLRGAGSDVIELNSGCICCTLTADLLYCLDDIREKFKPRRILIESSGVADPASVIAALTHSKLIDHMELEKIITVLDADLWQYRENFGNLFLSQLHTADMILLNKIDMVEPDLIPIFLKEIHKEIVGAQVVPTIRCSIDTETLWSPTKPKMVELQPMGFFEELSLNSSEIIPKHASQSDETPSTSVAANNFVTFSFETARNIDERCFRQFIDQLPWELFRLKGMVQFADRLALVNFVGGKTEWMPMDGEQKTQLAFIGWDVDSHTMLNKLEGCLI
jgi:G3E family GTPase